LGSCARETVIDNIAFPNVSSKSAVYCLLTPGDSVWVVVKAVQAINSQSANGTTSISGAKVTLENSTTGQQIVLRSTKQSGYYGCSQRDFPVLPGQRYSLLVSGSNLDTMQATCQIPIRPAQIDTITYGESYNDSFFRHRRVTITWLDVSAKNEPYSYFLSSRYLYDGDTLKHTSFDNTLITRVNSQLYYNDDTIDSGTPQTYYLFTADQSTYTFLVLAQRMNNVSGGNSGDLFGSYQGIIPSFTNIKNGYGIFGAYLKTSKTITFP